MLLCKGTTDYCNRDALVSSTANTNSNPITVAAKQQNCTVLRPRVCCEVAVNVNFNEHNVSHIHWHENEMVFSYTCTVCTVRCSAQVRQMLEKLVGSRLRYLQNRVQISSIGCPDQDAKTGCFTWALQDVTFNYRKTSEKKRYMSPPPPSCSCTIYCTPDRFPLTVSVTFVGIFESEVLLANLWFIQQIHSKSNNFNTKYWCIYTVLNTMYYTVHWLSIATRELWRGWKVYSLRNCLPNILEVGVISIW